MIFLHACGGVFSLIVVVALGYWLARTGWFDPTSRKMLPRLITNVSLPPFLACTIISSMRRSELGQMLHAALLPFLTMAALFAAAWLFARMTRVSPRHFGLFCACVSNPNTIFIGIPVNRALFGPESLPYVLLYYFASTIFFWTVGNYFISRDQRADNSARERPGAIRWGQILSPPMLGFIAGMGVLATGMGLPDFLMNAASLIGEMTTPLALIFIGITLEEIGLRNLKPNGDMLAALVGRMLASPALMFACVALFGLPDLMGKVFVMQSSLPVLMQVAILSAYYNTDPRFGTMMVALSTLLCVITIPIYMILL